MHNRKISVIGLGYVGLPLAVAFGKQAPVIAFDIKQDRIAELKNGEDSTREVAPDALQSADLLITDDASDLKKADFHIVTVPTPITDSRRPDLRPVIGASKTVGQVLKKGDIVVYESTVYPGVTDNICVAILEEESGLKFGKDFTVGYSPERINPGDKEHRLETIVKVVSGSDADTLAIVADVYGDIIEAGIHKAPDIKTAEAAKVIENTQRDLNIALMNELALIFDRLDIDTQDVLAAAGTKWNFLKFFPGLVGGHCIGVDPYYLTHRAEETGYTPQVILSGRRINDGMGAFVAQQAIKNILKNGGGSDSVVTVMGLTFKENCPDLRNSRVIDIIRELQDFGLTVQVTDPMADPAEAKEEYGIDLMSQDELKKADALILAVAHQEYVAEGWPFLMGLLNSGNTFLADVKGCLDRQDCPKNITLWRL